MQNSTDYTLESTLPASLDAERSILGAVLLDNAALVQASGLRGDDFSLDSHRRIYLRMLELAAKSSPIDTVTLTEELARRREVEAIGGVAYLTSLTDGLPRRPNIAHYVKIVRDKAALRRLINVCNATIARAAEQSDAAEIILADATASVSQVWGESTARGGRITKLEDIPDPFSLGTEGVPWLIENLIPARAITVLAGEPGAGKTWLALLVAKASKLGGDFLGRKVERGDVLYLDRENPLPLVRERLEIICGGPGVLNPWGNWCTDEPPLIGDPRLLDFAKQGLLIVFDSLIRFHKAENENDASEMSKVMAQLRALASAGATVLALHHKAKSETSSYRGSSDIAGGADAVFTLAKREGMLELKSLKIRGAADVILSVRPRIMSCRVAISSSRLARLRGWPF